MDKLLVFSVFDSKVEGFLQPFFCVSQGVAVRNFMSAVADQGHEFNRYAEDYTLFQLGHFLVAEGKFVNEVTPYSVISATAMLALVNKRLKESANA